MAEEECNMIIIYRTQTGQKKKREKVRKAKH